MILNVLNRYHPILWQVKLTDIVREHEENKLLPVT